MDSITVYFWFFCGIFVGIGNTIFAWMRCRGEFAGDQEELEKLKRFLIGFALSIIIPCCLLGIIQIIGGYKDGFFINTYDFTNIYVLLSWIVIITSWILLLLYLWYWNGGETLHKYRKGFRLPDSIMGIKVLLTIIVLIASSSFFLGNNKIIPSEKINTAELKEGESEIFIASIPPVADVYLDDEFIGKTNVEKLKVLEGEHKVRFVKDSISYDTLMTFKMGKNPSILIRFNN